MMTNNSSTVPVLHAKSQHINARQLAFLVAFLLPAQKLLELPSLLTAHAGGDLLIAALFGLTIEFIPFCCLLFFCKRTKTAPIEALERRCGKITARIFCGVFGAFLLLYAVLPLLDLEKFSHAAFSDTSPTFFIFAPFFVLGGFICTKGLSAYGRASDLLPMLFLLPILGLIGMSLTEADFTRLLPVMEKPLTVSRKAGWKTTAYFSSGSLLLPMMSAYQYRDGDEKKLLSAFGVGAVLTLLFLATFFAVFGLTGEKEHYAVMKLAQYFPALKFVGRIDLLLVYTLSIGLFYYTALPMQLFTECFTRCFSLRKKWITASVLSVLLLLFTLFCNKYWRAIHAFFSEAMPPVFLLFSVGVPIAFLLLLGQKRQGRYENNSKTEEETEVGNGE